MKGQNHVTAGGYVPKELFYYYITLEANISFQIQQSHMELEFSQKALLFFTLCYNFRSFFSGFWQRLVLSEEINTT
ncbi:CLUMA_CG015529, isoform A [Clunio marinus]|uniref:CLUMA_CG015529, isoform A n=1 Tax=Clunio marinus TaxID=568069 RepID=A0A1J1ITD2_9DIPT|nr:CLUMA_CG015529, isoform A [Clunio marinus]